MQASNLNSASLPALQMMTNSLFQGLLQQAFSPGSFHGGHKQDCSIQGQHTLWASSYPPRQLRWNPRINISQAPLSGQRSAWCWGKWRHDPLSVATMGNMQDGRREAWEAQKKSSPAAITIATYLWWLAPRWSPLTAWQFCSPASLLLDCMPRVGRDPASLISMTPTQCLIPTKHSRTGFLDDQTAGQV